jgi:hypothetical protein
MEGEKIELSQRQLQRFRVMGLREIFVVDEWRSGGGPLTGEEDGVLCEKKLINSWSLEKRSESAILPTLWDRIESLMN